MRKSRVSVRIGESHGKINEVEKNSTTTKYIIKLDKALTNYNNDYECMAIDNLSYQFTIKDEKELSQLIQNLVLQKLNILDVIKIEDDLEDEYSKIYEVTK